MKHTHTQLCSVEVSDQTVESSQRNGHEGDVSFSDTSSTRNYI